jgi:GNAT superfamily N-acetyltransferase
MHETGDMKDAETEIVRLRPGTEADIPAILTVTQAAYAPHTERMEPPSSVWRENDDAVRHYLEQGGVIVAEAGDAIVGTVRYEAREDYVYLGRLAVLPAWQGRGIGRRLVAAVEEWTLLLGLDEVRIGVRLELSENHDLYKHLGFVEDGLAPFTYDPSRSYLKMKKQLRER